jgi:hypothetical protein
MNEARPYADQVKPYSFMLVGHRDPDPTVLGPDGANVGGVGCNFQHLINIKLSERPHPGSSRSRA